VAYDGRTGRLCGGLPNLPWIVVGPNDLERLLAYVPVGEEDGPAFNKPLYSTGRVHSLAGLGCEEIFSPAVDRDDEAQRYCLTDSIRLRGVQQWIPVLLAAGMPPSQARAWTDDRGVIASEIRKPDGRLVQSAVAVHVERASQNPALFSSLCDGLVL